jgi:multidrug efflux pump subunit AcrB
MIRFFAGHPTAANLLMLLIAVMGLLSLSSLRRETFADFTPSEVEVRVAYPGASPEEVEETVCERLEDSLQGVAGLHEVRCEARENLAFAVVEMQPGANLDRFTDDVRTEVEAIDTFPDLAERPILHSRGRHDRVAAIAVTGPMAPGDLKAYCEQLADRLRQNPQITRVILEGFSERRLFVSLSSDTLRTYGIGVQDVANALRSQSVDLPAGSLETAEETLSLRFVDQRRKVIELENLLVVGRLSGAEIRLGDLAEIHPGFEFEEEKVRFNGEPAGLLRIEKTKAQDSLRVMAALETFLAKERLQSPPGVELALTQDVSNIIRDRLQLLFVNGYQGLILVFLVMWLFFGVRFAFWVSMGLPVSFLGGLFLMGHAGQTINMVTMVGLLIALGLLMDDAIVIAENIATRRQEGESPLEAAVNGSGEVAIGVFSSFLTTISVFGPLAFMAGDMGKVLRVMPVVLILVLSVSLVEAFFILPAHLSHVPIETVPGWIRQKIDVALEFLRERILGRSVDQIIRYRYLFLALMGALFLVSLGQISGGRLKFLAFPEIDGEILEIRLMLLQSTPLARTEAVVEKILKAMEKIDQELTPLQPGGKQLVRQITVQHNLNTEAHDQGPHLATVTFDLLAADQRNTRMDDIISRLDALVGVPPDVLSLTMRQKSIRVAGMPLEVRLQGDDLEKLQAASGEMIAWFRSYQGTRSLSQDLFPGKNEILMRLRKGALAAGLSAREVANQLRASFHGVTATQSQVKGESQEVEVRLRESEQDGLEDLLNFQVTRPDATATSLESLVHLIKKRSWARISRVNGRRTVTIQGEVDARIANTKEIVDETRARFIPGFLKRHPSVTVTWLGQEEQSRLTGGSLRQGALLGLIGVFFILSYQFGSYLEPLVVMAAIPLALIGVIWGHLLMGQQLCMPSVVGFVSLSGIVVNDSILLVEFLKAQISQGTSVQKAAREASRKRFRAVLLTSLTTIAGLLPLLFSRSMQAQVLIPLATSIVFGLAASTLLVLLVVPSLYCVVGDVRGESSSQGNCTSGR